LRTINIQPKRLILGMCKPDGLPNVFIEDSFLSLDEIYGKLPPEELGCITNSDVINEDANPNDC